MPLDEGTPAAMEPTAVDTNLQPVNADSPVADATPAAVEETVAMTILAIEPTTPAASVANTPAADPLAALTARVSTLEKWVAELEHAVILMGPVILRDPAGDLAPDAAAPASLPASTPAPAPAPAPAEDVQEINPLQAFAAERGAR